MDIVLETLSGLEAAAEIKKLLPSSRILFMSARVDPAFVLEALETQAAGYLVKTEFDFDDLRGAIHRAYRGERVFTRTARLVAAALQEDHETRDLGPWPPGRQPLTDRERQVFRMHAQGTPIPAVAEGLGIKTATARDHWNHALDKLGIRAEAGPGYVPRFS